MTSNLPPDTVVVTLSDQSYFPRASRTIHDVRGPGRYQGPIVFIAIDFEPPADFCDRYKVEVWRRGRIDTSVLDAQIHARPFTGGDGRERTKTIQWSKIHAFDPEFARRWRRVVFMDAGLRVFRDLAPIFQHPWERSIVALDDSHPDDTKRFGCQLETRADPEAHERLGDLVKMAGCVAGDLSDERYFLNCFWIYDTALSAEDLDGPFRGLCELMERFPVFRTNEMGAMNVYFQFLRRQWRPLQIDRQGQGRPLLFDWSERDGRTWRDYVMMKYPTTLGSDEEPGEIREKRLALVTCLYDLVRRGSSAHRTIDWMLDNAGFVLGQDRELVIFTDPDPEVEALLLDRRAGHPTTIIGIPLEDLLRPDRATATALGALQVNALKTKVTQPFVQLMWSKYAMLERALAATDASHLGWIDLGITHVGKPPPDGIDVFADPPDKPRVHVLRMFSKADVDRSDYWQSVHGHLAGGLVVGARDGIRGLVNDFWRAIDRAISMGLSPLDEGLLSYVVAQRPNDFSYSYGDYADILRNHDAPRSGEAHCSWIVSDARSRGLPDTMDGPSRKTCYVHDPARGSTAVVGFPAVILGYSADATTHIVPGRYERDLVDWSLQLASKDKQFVDIGAHMGSWTLVMAPHFREVHAFEPQRLIYQQLCGNAALNGLTNVFARNVGLDEAPGCLTLQRPGVDRGSSSARSDVASRFSSEGVALSPETIDVVTLDSFASVLTDVGLVKIDVEGLELRVLKGAVEVLRQNALPKLLVECWSADWYAQDKEDLLDLLDDLGYRVMSIAGYADMLLAEKR